MRCSAGGRWQSRSDLVGTDLSVLIELLSVGVIRLDQRRHIVLANAAAHTFLERAPGTLIGMTRHRGLSRPPASNQVVDEAERSGRAARGGPYRDRVRRRGPCSSGARWRRLAHPGGMCELRRLQQIRAEFIDNLSHELRTPLTTVSLLAETLTREAAAAGDAIRRGCGPVRQGRGRDRPSRPDGQ